MIKLPRDYGMAVLLTALSGLMLLVLAGEGLHFRGARKDIAARSAVKPATGQESAPKAGEIGETPALESYGEMVDRPLFLQTRRPPTEDQEEETPPAPAEPKTPLNAKLMGVILTPTGKIALLVDEKGKYKRAHKNTVVDGWKLMEIQDDRVTLEQAGEHKDLMLLKPKPKPNAPPPPKAAGKATVKGPGQAGTDEQDTGDESDDADTNDEDESDTTDEEDTGSDESDE